MWVCKNKQFLGVFFWGGGLLFARKPMIRQGGRQLLRPLSRTKLTRAPAPIVVNVHLGVGRPEDHEDRDRPQRHPCPDDGPPGIHRLGEPVGPMGFAILSGGRPHHRSTPDGSTGGLTEGGGGNSTPFPPPRPQGRPCLDYGPLTLLKIAAANLRRMGPVQRTV